MLYGSTRSRCLSTLLMGVVRSDKDTTSARNPEFSVKWTAPAASPAMRSDAVPCPEPDPWIQANAAQAATLARNAFEALKTVRNQPLRMRNAAPIGSASAPTAAPAGPKVTARPIWMNGVGTQATLVW